MRLLRPWGSRSRSKLTSQELLNNVQVASPCHVSWDSMTGTDRERFCGQCEKSVYHLSSMTADEAVNLIREKQGNLCIQLFRRTDGTVISEDCPKGLKRLQQAMLKKLACVLAAIGWFGAAGMANAQSLEGAPTSTGGQSAPIKSYRVEGLPPRAGNQSHIRKAHGGNLFLPSAEVILNRSFEAGQESCSFKSMMRWLIGVVGLGALIVSFKNLKKKPTWIVGSVFFVVCAICGLTWL